MLQARQTAATDAGDVRSISTVTWTSSSCTASARRTVSGLKSWAVVLEGHLREHLGGEDRSPEQRREDLEQVVGVLRSYLK